MLSRRVASPALCAVIALVGGCGQPTDDLVVYSSRAEQLVRPLFDAFAEETGIEVAFITDKAGALTQRLRAESRRTPADVLFTVDAGNLWFAADQGLLQPVESDVLETTVPAHLRDPDDRWFGFSIRARTIVYHTGRVDESSLSGYEALSDSAWRGRLCLRTAKKVYNQSLVAMLIAQHGEARAMDVVSGWVSNLATAPFSNDTQVIEAIAAGQCDVGIVNSYYFGRLQRERPDLPVAIYWAGTDGGGVHVNVSGAGVVRHARHPQKARRFLEWLVSPRAQELLARGNLEFPVRKDVALDPIVAAWGPFRASEMNLAKAGELQADAVRLMDRAGYH